MPGEHAEIFVGLAVVGMEAGWMVKAWTAERAESSRSAQRFFTFSLTGCMDRLPGFGEPIFQEQAVDALKLALVVADQDGTQAEGVGGDQQIH